MVVVDVLGPFSLATDRNRYNCVVMDYFTKWPKAYAIPDNIFTTTAKALMRMNCSVALMCPIDSILIREEFLAHSLC